MVLDSLHQYDLQFKTTIVAIVVGLVSLFYFIYRRYVQGCKYESINENEALKAKMEAARLKQQEIYNRSVQEYEAKKAKEAETKKEQESKSNESGGEDNSKSTGSDTLSGGFFPLMGNSNSYYRPARKRACGPCGGGGCG